jgi:invasion protein IalB
VRITSLSCRLAATLIIGMGLAGAALAQTQQPVQQQFGPRASKAAAAGQTASLPPPELIATHGAWRVQCETVPPGAAADGQTEGQRQCGMIQSAASEKNPKAQLTLVIIKAKQADKVLTMMRVLAPIGVFLPTGVALEIDGDAVGRVPFTRCMPQACIAFAEASPETLGKLKKGTEANFIIYEAPGLGLPMKFSLDGFSAALGELDNL